MRITRLIMLILLGLTLIAAFDFGISFFGMLAASVPEPRIPYGLVARLVFRDGATAQDCFPFFAVSALAALATGITNIILGCIKVMQRELEL